MTQTRPTRLLTASAFGLIAAVALTLAPAPAQAHGSVVVAQSSSQVVSTMSRDQLKAFLTSEGYSFTTDEDGDIVWKIEGFRTLLLVAKDEKSIQFRAAFGDGNATLKKVNEWNRTKKYSRSYLDNEGDPVLELDLDLDGGVARARIADFLKTCRISFTAWQDEVVK